MPLFIVMALSLLHGRLWVNFASSSSQLLSLVKSISFEGFVPVLIGIGGNLLISQCISIQIGYRSTPFHLQFDSSTICLWKVKTKCYLAFRDLHPLSRGA